MGKKVFITGATGYIGGSVAKRLVDEGFTVTGLCRSEEKASGLEALGITPVLGSLDDSKVLSQAASAADIIINAASSDHRAAVEAMIPALYGTKKVFIQNSGSSIVSSKGTGERSNDVFDEDTVYDPVVEKKERVALDETVLDSSDNGVHALVVCPCLIYGQGLGLEKESAQVPLLVRHAINSGESVRIGKGENIWSSVHIEDLVDLYIMLVKNPPEPGTFLFAENGEVEFKDIAEEIRKSLELSQPVKVWTPEEATQIWGAGMALFAIASNSRIRSKRAKAFGWSPKYDSVLQDISRCCANIKKEPVRSISPH